MVAMLAALLFSLALAMALGTIFHMGNSHGEKALAALRMDHRPAPAPRAVHIHYSPARGPRLALRDDMSIRTSARRNARAA